MNEFIALQVINVPRNIFAKSVSANLLVLMILGRVTTYVKDSRIAPLKNGMLQEFDLNFYVLNVYKVTNLDSLPQFIILVTT